MTREDQEVRIGALSRLAVATREKLDPEAFLVYLDNLSTYRNDTVVQACRNLESSAEWFPKVAELVAECRSLVRNEWERDEQIRLRKYLEAAGRQPPLSDEKRAEFLAQIRRAIGKHAMPAADRALPVDDRNVVPFDPKARAAGGEL